MRKMIFLSVGRRVTLITKGEWIDDRIGCEAKVDWSPWDIYRKSSAIGAERETRGLALTRLWPLRRGSRMEDTHNARNSAARTASVNRKDAHCKAH